MSGVEITVETEVTTELVEAFDRLIPQLSRSSPPPGEVGLQAIIDSNACHLISARDEDGHILGSMTLVVFPIPTGVRGWIEDVVVDETARGMGVGARLNLAALDLAVQLGAKTIDLTSRPSREAANRLYQRLGFVERETNVYRYSPEV